MNNMKLVIYSDMNKFYKENINLLEKEEAINNLMIANMIEGLKLGNIEDWVYGKVTNQEKVELIFLQRPPYQLLMYSPTKNKKDELYKFLAEQLYKIIPDLSGVNSEIKIANKFATYFVKKANKKIKIKTNLCILKLEELNQITLSDGDFRQAKKEDLEILISFFDEFYQETLEIRKEKAEIEEECIKCLEDLYIFEKDGKIVSQACQKRKVLNGQCISIVYTDKQQRGKGYARTCVYYLTKKALQENRKYCVLYTDASNPISNHVYEKIGYKKISDQIELIFIDEVQEEG